MKSRRQILITNDDSYTSKGMQTLCEIMSAYGDVTVVAPKRGQSGMSMAVTMGLKPIGVKRLEDRQGQRWWYLDGTPASCIKYGIDNIFHPEMPDLVVSGINHGSNAATAAIYSGTIGAAMEGAVNLIPSIGVSLDSFEADADFGVVRTFLPRILDFLLERMQPKTGLFYNINFPAIKAEEVKGVKVCHMGLAHWEREYRPYFEFLDSLGRKSSEEDLLYARRAEEQGEELVVMAGDFTDNPQNSYPADHHQLAQGWITIVPGNIDNTDYSEIERLCDITL